MCAARPTDFTPYPWMERAFLALAHGVKKGRDRPLIYDFLRYDGRSHVNGQTAWCSAFVNYRMEQAGLGSVSGFGAVRKPTNDHRR
jgi:hypothetical protein